MFSERVEHELWDKRRIDIDFAQARGYIEYAKGDPDRVARAVPSMYWDRLKAENYAPTITSWLNQCGGLVMVRYSCLPGLVTQPFAQLRPWGVNIIDRRHWIEDTGEGCLLPPGYRFCCGKDAVHRHHDVELEEYAELPGQPKSRGIYKGWFPHEHRLVERHLHVYNEKGRLDHYLSNDGHKILLHHSAVKMAVHDEHHGGKRVEGVHSHFDLDDGHEKADKFLADHELQGILHYDGREHWHEQWMKYAFLPGEDDRESRGLFNWDRFTRDAKAGLAYPGPARGKCVDVHPDVQQRWDAGGDVAYLALEGVLKTDSIACSPGEPAVAGVGSVTLWGPRKASVPRAQTGKRKGHDIIEMSAPGEDLMPWQDVDQLQGFVEEKVLGKWGELRIVPDSDFRGNEQVEKQAFKLVKMLERMGQPASVVLLPATCGDECTHGRGGKPEQNHKYGIDDYRRDHPNTSLLTLPTQKPPARARHAPPPPPKMRRDDGISISLPWGARVSSRNGSLLVWIKEMWKESGMDYADVSDSMLAEGLDVSPKSANRALHQLEDIGEVRLEKLPRPAGEKTYVNAKGRGTRVWRA